MWTFTLNQPLADNFELFTPTAAPPQFGVAHLTRTIGICSRFYRPSLRHTEREREKWELRCHFNWHVTNSHRLPTNHQRESTSPRENGDKSSSAQPQFWRGENLNPFTCISRELRVCHLAASVRRYGMWRFPIESTYDKMTQRWQLAPTNPSNRVQCCLQAIIFKLCKLGAVGWGNVFINQLVVFFGDDHHHQCSSSSDPETWPSRRGLWEIIVVGLGGRISVDTCWLQQLPRGELVGSLHNSYRRGTTKDYYCTHSHTLFVDVKLMLKIALVCGGITWVNREREWWIGF